MPVSSQLTPNAAERIASLEARLARLEAYVGLVDETPCATARRRALASADELEFQMGQNWFARVGIMALALGGGFMLTLPYPELPAAAPPLGGILVAGVLFAASHRGRRSFPLVSRHLRGAGMALLYCAVLRAFFFSERPLLRAEPLGGGLLLIAAAGVNLWIGWRRRSPWLMGLALVTASATPLALGTPAFLLPSVIVLSLATLFVSSRARARWLYPLGLLLTFSTYLAWAMGNPVLGLPYRWAAEPSIAPMCLLLAVTIFGLIPLTWDTNEPDDPATATGAALNCIFGYGVFWVHTYAVNTPHFSLIHVVASIVYLWIGALFWLRRSSQVATFFYAMCGYGALSVAILRLSEVPDVFVWLSVESVLVVATAIWFQSRFIVVANFLIYVAVVLGYMVLNQRESGVSIAFGLVALTSARILNWQRHRLELKTEIMRNAYLLGAFAVFPYALLHLVEPRFVALAWVGLAGIYYALNVVIRNQKYRWMAHATLLLTAAYLSIPSHPGLTPAYRIASFLALGAALLVVSLSFTHSRRRGGHPSHSAAR